MDSPLRVCNRRIACDGLPIPEAGGFYYRKRDKSYQRECKACSRALAKARRVRRLSRGGTLLELAWRFCTAPRLTVED